MNPGRNEPCPCGSQRRYKACCGRLADAPAVQPLEPVSGPQPSELTRLTGLLDGARYAELESSAAELLEEQPNSALLQLLELAS